MDLNLDLGLPLCPPPLSLDLGYDLALNALPLPFSSSHIDDMLMRIPSIEALDPFDEILNNENMFEPFDLPPHINTPPNPHSASVIIDDEPLARTGGPALRRELVEYPEFRLQGFFGSRRWSEMPMSRSNQAESDGVDSTTDPERLMREIRRSARSVGSVRKRKANEKAPQAEDSEDEKKEKSSGASDFDCNICFEVAKEPVVTCCGHLFCWPCLHRWLHVHCSYKECPVCKGKVNESSIVPIYGRGSSESGREKKKKKDEANEHEDLKTPPRPQGNRVEGLRQQLHSPLFRRSEAFFQEVHELFSDLPERLRLFQREREERRIHAQPPARYDPVISPGLTWTRLPSDVPRDPNQSPSQASTSSTVAVVQGDVMAGSDASPGANDGGTPMVLRSRVRRRSSNSLDVSGRPAPHLRPSHRRRGN